MKVLYVAPLAHLEGHTATATLQETAALARAGHDITVFTFAGFIAERPKVKQRQKVKSREVYRKMSSMRYVALMASVIAQVLTLVWASDNATDFDCLILRDGSSVTLPLISILSIFSAKTRWLVWLVRKDISGWPKLSNVKYVRIGKDVPLWCPEVVSLPTMKEARQKLAIRDDAKVLLFFGSHHAGKEIGTVLKAPKEWLVLMVGRIYPWQTAPLSSCMVHPYYVSEAEKPFYYRAADAVLLSYAKDSPTVPSLLWEAAAYEAPVVASDVDGLGALVRDYGLGTTFEAGNASSLAAALSSEKEGSPRFADFKADYSTEKWAVKVVELAR